MRVVNLNEENEIIEFAKRSGKYLAENKEKTTCTDSEIKAGCLFALRFDLDDNCVVVFKLDENFEPINFRQLIKQCS